MKLMLSRIQTDLILAGTSSRLTVLWLVVGRLGLSICNADFSGCGWTMKSMWQRITWVTKHRSVSMSL